MTVIAAEGAEGALVEVLDDRVVLTRNGFFSSLRQGRRVEVPLSDISDVLVTSEWPGLRGVFVLISPGEVASGGFAANNTNPKSVYFDRWQQPAFEKVRSAILERIARPGRVPAPVTPWAPDRPVLLFLAARPRQEGIVDLDVDLEQRVVVEEIQRTDVRGLVDVRLRPAVSVDNLLNDTLLARPTVLHFSGHGLVDGLIVETPGRGATLAREAALVRLCQIPEVAEELRLLVLNACLSAPQARTLASTVDAVVGTLDTVLDTTAIAFSKGFYNALGRGHSTASAFSAGVAQVSLENGEAEAQKYALFPKPGLDPSTWGLLD